jgi:hypothetical protein
VQVVALHREFVEAERFAAVGGGERSHDDAKALPAAWPAMR